MKTAKETKEIKTEKKENKNKHEVTIKIDGDAWKNAIDKVFAKKFLTLVFP